MHGFTLVYIGVRAGARTGYVIPGRDGIGGLDLAKNSSAAVVVVVAVRQRRWIGCGLAAPLDCFRYTGVILHADRKSNGRDGKSNGKDM